MGQDTGPVCEVVERSMNCEYHQLLNNKQTIIATVETAFANLVKSLQDNCKHEEITEWLEDCSTEARLCKRCMVEMERRRKNRIVE